MSIQYKSVLVLFGCIAVLCLLEGAHGFTLPPKGDTSSYIRNVKTQWGAKGDGVTDDTAAIQAAISTYAGWGDGAGYVYLPAGTYVINNTLIWKGQDGEWIPSIGLIGDSAAVSKIVLSPSAVGYDDPANPKSMVFTASAHYGGESPYQKETGGGNQAFKNYIFDLTLDTGTHTGAIGIDYIGNNNAAIRNVVITGSGTAGLAIYRDLPGPMLVSNVTVNGFQVGVEIGSPQYSIALEHLFVNGQSVAGLRSNMQTVTIRGMFSQNPTVPAVIFGSTGALSIIDSVFSGCPSNMVVMNITGASFLRNLTAKNCDNAVAVGQTRGPISFPVLEYATTSYTLLYNSSQSLALPILDTPRYDENDPNEWAFVEDYGANGYDQNDDTEAIQRALNSGKSIIYFSKGRFFMSYTMKVSGNVRKILGYETTIAPKWGTFGNESAPEAVFHVVNNSQPVIFFEYIYISRITTPAPPNSGMIFILHDSPSDVVLIGSGTSPVLYAYQSTMAAGTLFLEDFVSDPILIAKPGQKVFARHFNAEGNQVRMYNQGGHVWILGFKIEGINTLIQTTNGGKTEILGAYIYPVGNTIPGQPAFWNIDSQFSLTASYQSSYNDLERFDLLITEQRNGMTANFTHSMAIGYGYGEIIPLFSSVVVPPSSTKTSTALSSTTKASTTKASTTISSAPTTTTANGRDVSAASSLSSSLLAIILTVLLYIFI